MVYRDSPTVREQGYKSLYPGLDICPIEELLAIGAVNLHLRMLQFYIKTKSTISLLRRKFFYKVKFYNGAKKSISGKSVSKSFFEWIYTHQKKKY